MPTTSGAQSLRTSPWQLGTTVLNGEAGAQANEARGLQCPEIRGQNMYATCPLFESGEFSRLQRLDMGWEGAGAMARTASHSRW
jgi:hypothetical protein